MNLVKTLCNLNITLNIFFSVRICIFPFSFWLKSYTENVIFNNKKCIQEKTKCKIKNLFAKTLFERFRR